MKSIKINVPFYKSKKEADCGPLALKMILKYFGENHSFEELSELEKALDSGMVWSLGIARAAKKLGFPVKFISDKNFNFEEDEIDFYKKYADNKAMLILKKLKKDAKKLGIKIQKKNIPIEELLTYVSKNSIPIVLINWYVISGKRGFNGHFLPITGYDNKKIYVHNPGLASAQSYLPIKRELFLKAWESKGTNKDTIIIYRK